jgi:fumarate reductase flavoprotein subunit
VTATTKESFDVVVVGAGLAGLVAALTAAEDGVEVALLEKGSEFGGSSARSGGGLIFTGTDLQRQAGVEDSLESLREDLTRAGHGRARPDVIDAYVDHQLDAYRWLSGLGLQFSLESATTATKVPRAHLTGRGVATQHLHECVTNNSSITYLPSTAARRLLRRDGVRVDAVEASSEQETRTLLARSGIVLATGGFARNVEMLRSFAPRWADAVKMSGPHNTGDGITMAWALGAGVADMPYVAASFGASIARYPDLTLDPDEEPILLYPNYLGGIIVSLDGRRFANEDLQYKVLSRLCADQRGAAAVQVFDEAIFLQSDDRATPWDFRAALDAGLIVKADSVRQLAVALRLDPDVLLSTVHRYNQAVLDGEDRDFARPVSTHRDRPGGGLITTAPFYGFPTRPGLTSTYAGLTVDRDMRVLDVFGAPIVGLFAAGETVGGFHGAGYYGGTGLGKAAVFGRIAGRNAVKS